MSTYAKNHVTQERRRDYYAENGAIFVFDPEFAQFCDEHAKQLANEFKRRASESGFINAVSEYKLIGLEGAPFTRNGVGLEFQISNAAVQAIFELEINGTTEPIKVGDGRYAVAALTDIIALQEKDPTAQTSLTSELIRSMQNDLLITVQNALHDHYGLKVDERLLDNLF